MSHSDPKRYTKPELRDRIKEKITAGDKGGKPGQWSARKAQLVTHEYEAEGGDYKGGRGPAQESLKEWGDEKWRTADKQKAVRKGGTARYLPDKAWEELTPAQQKATDRKKREGSREGKQFVANTEQAATARRHATKATGKTAVRKSAASRKFTPRATAKKSPAKKTAASKRARSPRD